MTAGLMERAPQAVRHVGKLEVLRLVIPAQENELPTVEPAEDAQPVEFRLEQPVGVVERLGHQRAEHWFRLARQRGRGEVACQFGVEFGNLSSSARERGWHGLPSKI